MEKKQKEAVDCPLITRQGPQKMDLNILLLMTLPLITAKKVL